MAEKQKRPSIYFISSIVWLLGIKLMASHMLSKCPISLGTPYPFQCRPASFLSPPPFSFFLFFITFSYFLLSFLSFAHPYPEIYDGLNMCIYFLLSPSLPPTPSLYMSFILMCFLMDLFETEQYNLVCLLCKFSLLALVLWKGVTWKDCGWATWSMLDCVFVNGGRNPVLSACLEEMLRRSAVSFTGRKNESYIFCLVWLQVIVTVDRTGFN